MEHGVSSKVSFLLLISLFGHAQLGSSQDQVSLAAGLGLPELLHMGVRYEIRQFQVGAGVGFVPVGSGESVIAVFGDAYYHFAGDSRLSDRRPWYGRAGLNYLRDETEDVIDRWVYLNTRIGRDFNFSDRAGIALDVGASFELSYATKDKMPSGGWTLSVDTPAVIPSIGLDFFFKL